MNNKIKFKIGEFSKLCQVTVKTLRYYEEIGILVPFEIDEWTGYRYYDTSQFRKMTRILYLKRLGFSLEEIHDLFDDGRSLPDSSQIAKKLKECENDLQLLKSRQKELTELEDILHNQENVMEKVFTKRLPSRVFATHRQKVDSYQELFNLCPNVIGPEMERLGCECPEPEYCFTIEHQEEYGKDIDIEYFEAVSKKGEDSDIIKFKELPEANAICINHYGIYEKLPESLSELYTFAEANGYEIDGLPRFCYIDGIWNKEKEDEWLTEVQLPVKNIA